MAVEIFRGPDHIAMRRVLLFAIGGDSNANAAKTRGIALAISGHGERPLFVLRSDRLIWKHPSRL
jgi:hypothetical protein